jgi:hypothetical protein
LVISARLVSILSQGHYYRGAAQGHTDLNWPRSEGWKRERVYSSSLAHLLYSRAPFYLLPRHFRHSLWYRCYAELAPARTLADVNFSLLICTCTSRMGTWVNGFICIISLSTSSTCRSLGEGWRGPIRNCNMHIVNRGSYSTISLFCLPFRIHFQSVLHYP